MAVSRSYWLLVAGGADQAQDAQLELQHVVAPLTGGDQLREGAGAGR